MIPSLLSDTVTYDLERAVHYALLWGLEGLELRSVGGPNDRVPFVNEQKLKLRLIESELPVVAVDPGMFVGSVEDRSQWMNELLELDQTIEFCRRIGCDRIVVSSFLAEGEGDDTSIAAQLPRAADAIRRAALRAEGSGVRLCILNERGYLASTGAALTELIEEIDSDVAVAAWSPAEALIAGEDPAAGLDAVANHVALVRCRNVAVGNETWEARPLEDGDVDWFGQLGRLAQAGFDGPLCLEVDLEPVGKQGLYASREIIRLMRDVRRGLKHESS